MDVEVTPLERFKAQLERAAIGPDKPLYPVLMTVFQACHDVRDAIGGARGLTPQGEADLVQRVAYTATTATKQSMRELVSQIKLRTIAIIALGAVVLSIASATAGYFLHDSAPVFAGVRAGLDRCEDLTDGSRVCYIPVFERLPAKQTPPATH